MNRYQGLTILKTSTGRRYNKSVKYPDIPLSDNDFYIISVFGDRLDILANDYYSDTSLYWIISVANTIPRDSLYVPEGTQLRIPTDISNIIQTYNALNGIN